jgi:hypothetical protein
MKRVFVGCLGPLLFLVAAVARVSFKSFGEFSVSAGFLAGVSDFSGRAATSSSFANVSDSSTSSIETSFSASKIIYYLI